MANRIDCFKCHHFFITWDRKFPYGCKFMGFKSKVMPSQEVFSASGKACQSFKEKAGVSGR
ncbi:MAG: uracil-DNA glycosylase [Nitrospirae bacterium]|nr:uracil-DNA glycosylase [Nitrospirota bacterium]